MSSNKVRSKRKTNKIFNKPCLHFGTLDARNRNDALCIITVYQYISMKPAKYATCKSTFNS